ncbi:MAG: DUF3999 domain-containing protein [Gammaproteobacteria bacterium]|nr:DUF3999 domain-containing protein [Gammaproteobacteria bacterium]MCW8986492.1 DUF3999 domain-containing protein [Gammaproteobacteria bacterium]
MKFKLALLLIIFSMPKFILALTENDFAYIAETQTSLNTPFYELEIPTIVYESITRADLGDLRVLNGEGQVVPHGLRTIAAKRSQKTETINVPFFPLYQQTGQTTTDLHLNIKRNSQGEVINIHSRLPKDTKDNRLSGYLLDLREWNKPVQQIKVNWKNSGNASFIRKLKVSKSHDLEHWQVVATGKALVNMSYQNHHLVENTINVTSAQTHYLRLEFEDQQPGLELESIQVINTQSSRTKKENWKTVSVQAEKISGEYVFDNNLKSLVRQLEIKLPENNTVVNVQVLSRTNPEQVWRYRGSSLLYRLSVNGANIEKSTVNISANNDAQWLLRFDQQGGGIGTGSPEVKLSWQPQQLIFVARGEPPYRVVWGSTRVKPVNINANQLLPNMTNHSVKNENMISEALLLPRTMRPVNTQVLQPKEKEINWQYWILWSVLVGAVLMLIWMAVRLMKKMAD